MQQLARDLLLGRHHTFGAAEVDVDDPGLGAIDDSGSQLAAMLGDVTQHFVALEVVDVPEHGVLGGLRSHPLEVLRRQRADELASVRADDAPRDLERAALGVELHAHLAGRVERAHIGGRERGLDRVQHFLKGNADLRAERVQRFCEALG